MRSRVLVGLAVVVFGLYLAGMAALGTPPTASATGDQVAAWLRAHGEGVRWFVWAGTVDAPCLAALFALLRERLPAPHRDVFLIGAVSFVVTIAVQSWIWGGLALHAESVEPATARTLLDVARFWGPVLTGATMAMIGPVTWLALGGRGDLPRWLGVLGAIAFAEQAVETITIFGSTGFTEPGGAMNLQLGAALVSAWLLAFALWEGLRGTGPGRRSSALDAHAL